MKVIIWVGCMITPNIIAMLCIDNGIILGGIPSAILYALAVWLAKTLCGRLDWSRAMKEVKKSGMDITDYAKQGLTDEFVSQLPKNSYDKLKVILKKEKRKGTITHAQYIILLKLCSRTPGKDTSPKI